MSDKKELNFLYKVTQTVHSLEIDKVLKEIVKIAIQVTCGDSCLIYILDNKRNELVLRASKNPHPDLLRKIKMKVGVGLTGWVAKEKKPVAISSGASRDSRFKFFRSLPEDRFEAFLSVPILNKHGVCGVINVQHQQKHIHSKMEINLLSAIGKLVGGAVENALLIEESLALKEALDLRKLVEKAKGILMKKTGLSEDEAFHRLQKESMNTRKSLKEVAEAVILAQKLSLDKT
ncbi:hypothetical protein A3D78_00380 [Candidatus Gottesmanbacteria bacterium RIFCSPHIGHO2_02_FULL_39_14]|uniref:ANTAR domain-containing protein n=1 Tax=Candidatus Gottesmanbacteria bacterium RIFCSPHIGHO2_02_FULL_39_14 TaxID=1798383 RepID=A0A1F5ZTY1_9BACT|nr:MAG: hypothetical protein A3D78_00380 [Candidatus Gottesmanbacteria bacterium RIFCSPHIGHO2_02_FULL_39_14]